MAPHALEDGDAVWVHLRSEPVIGFKQLPRATIANRGRGSDRHLLKDRTPDRTDRNCRNPGTLGTGRNSASHRTGCRCCSPDRDRRPRRPDRSLGRPGRNYCNPGRDYRPGRPDHNCCNPGRDRNYCSPGTGCRRCTHRRGPGSPGTGHSDCTPDTGHSYCSSGRGRTAGSRRTVAATALAGALAGQAGVAVVAALARIAVVAAVAGVAGQSRPGRNCCSPGQGSQLLHPWQGIAAIAALTRVAVVAFLLHRSQLSGGGSRRTDRSCCTLGRGHNCCSLGSPGRDRSCYSLGRDCRPGQAGSQGQTGRVAVVAPLARGSQWLQPWQPSHGSQLSQPWQPWQGSQFIAANADIAVDAHMRRPWLQPWQGSQPRQPSQASQPLSQVMHL